MAVVGLTGSLCSGKSTVLKLLKNKGAVVFDVDKRIHQYYQNKKGIVYKKIAVIFPQVLHAGLISRKKLADIAFSDRSKLKVLEEIVHPVIIGELIEWVNEAKNKKRVYAAEVPLLFERSLTGYFNKVILVAARRKILIDRIVKKYNFSKKTALGRLSLYGSIREKIKEADFIVDNNLDLENLKEEVDLLWKRIR